jgi:UDP-glucuronate 4-epimerase
MKILVTGSAGFIGFHLVKRLLSSGHSVIGFDNLNEYYDIKIKYGRLRECGISIEKIEPGVMISSETFENYSFIKEDLENRESVLALFNRQNFDIVVHLAAQAGVRYSIENPFAYVSSNLVGFTNILEGCRHFGCKHLIYASTSSIYGLNEKMPLSEKDSANHPMTLYAATKKANELMAHSYSHLYGLPTTGLRFFTVYGPWGRPDMALFLFTDAIINNKPINLFNNGDMIRDFTYVEDIAESILRLCNSVPPAVTPHWNGLEPDPSTSSAPYRIFNIGNAQPVRLTEYVNCIQYYLNKKAIINYLPMQLGDVPKTHADVSSLSDFIKFSPGTTISNGVRNFIDWYLSFYKPELELK